MFSIVVRGCPVLMRPFTPALYVALGRGGGSVVLIGWVYAFLWFCVSSCSVPVGNSFA